MVQFVLVLFQWGWGNKNNGVVVKVPELMQYNPCVVRVTREDPCQASYAE